MSIVTVAIPPGLYMNGTSYDAKGRWADASRVRWHQNHIQPIGGWRAMADRLGTPLPPLSNDTTQTVYRDGFSWVSNANSRHYAFGANNQLKILLPSDTLVDVTPAGFVGSPPDPTINVGYGQWLYGLSTYGNARPIDPDATGRVHRWRFDTWGEDLLAGPSDPQYRGGIYVWDTSAQPTQATLIPNAPTDFTSFVVSDQRIVVGIGSDDEARLVRWSDRENYSEWTPTQLNYAGSQFLQGNGRLLSIHKVLNQLLILSENDAHVARFIGAPLVFGFDRVGDDCGPWSSEAIYVADRFAVWPGRRNFWIYDGTLKPLDCDIIDFINKDVSLNALAKVHCLGVPQFHEIWWYYQSKSSTTGEVDSYFSYNYLTGVWMKGKLPRTAGVSGEVYTNPVKVGIDTVAAEQLLYQHEIESIVVEETYAQTGPIELGEGETNMAVRYIYPDTENFGDVTYTFEGRDMPTSPYISYGPYVNDFNPISTRIMGRELKMRIDGKDLNTWQLGAKTRFDVAPIGTGRR